MQDLLYIEICAFALVILVLMYINMRYLQEKFLLRQKLFALMLLTLAVNLVLDTIVWLIDGKTGFTATIIIVGTAFLYVIISPIFFMMFALYSTLLIRDRHSIGKKSIILLILPVLVNMVLNILNLYGGFLFYYDSHNVYHRGRFFFLISLIWLIYAVYSFLFLVANRKKVHSRHVFPLLAAMIPPLVCGILQFYYYGLDLVWPSLTVSMQIIFMGIQNGHLYTDYLTGLYNRRQIDYYLEERLRVGKKHIIPIGIMLDLDHFKMINDTYGHTTGDQVLVEAAQILKTSFRKSDMICRYGGDEFIVLIDRKNEAEAEADIAKLRENVQRYNEKKKLPCEIRFSIGYEMFGIENQNSAKEFLERLDALMYRDKRSSRGE